MKCSMCDGKGWVYDFEEGVPYDCGKCHGTGKIQTESESRSECKYRINLENYTNESEFIRDQKEFLSEVWDKAKEYFDAADKEDDEDDEEEFNEE